MDRTTREKIAKKVQKQRKILNILYKLSSYGSKASAKEVILKTEVGTVRTLWYGFEDNTVKPVFFDMHGGGFILMSADADDAMNKVIANTVGCKVVSIDYSLAPECPFPTAVNEVYAVVKNYIKTLQNMVLTLILWPLGVTVQAEILPPQPVFKQTEKKSLDLCARCSTIRLSILRLAHTISPVRKVRLSQRPP